MSLLAILITVVAGLVMGAINNLAGGAGALGLVAFKQACGLSTPTANASLRLAAVTIGVCAFLGYRRAGQQVPARIWLLGIWAVPAAPLGSWLAMQVPELVFWLYLAAVLALLLRQQLKPLPLHAAGRHPHWQVALGCFLIGLHMGFAQIGVGLLSTLLLVATYDRDLVATTAAKSALVILTSIASVATFSAADAVAWQPALWLALGAGIGAFHISRWAVARGAGAVRPVVIAVAVLTLLYTLYQIGALLF